MSGSLTCCGGENVPGACASAILRIWQTAHTSKALYHRYMPCVLIFWYFLVFNSTKATNVITYDRRNICLHSEIWIRPHWICIYIPNHINHQLPSQWLKTYMRVDGTYAYETRKISLKGRCFLLSRLHINSQLVAILHYFHGTTSFFRFKLWKPRIQYNVIQAVQTNVSSSIAIGNLEKTAAHYSQINI